MNTQAERKIVSNIIRSMDEHPEKWTMEKNRLDWLYYNKGKTDEIQIWQWSNTEHPAHITKPEEYKFVDKSCEADFTKAVIKMKNALNDQRVEKIQEDILDILGSDIREERLKKLNQIEKKEKPLWKRLLNL